MARVHPILGSAQRRLTVVAGLVLSLCTSLPAQVGELPVSPESPFRFSRAERTPAGLSLGLESTSTVPMDVFASRPDRQTWDLIVTARCANADGRLALDDTNSALQRFYAAGNAAHDSDGDGLADARETLLLRTNPDLDDSDSDGIPDGADPNPWAARGAFDATSLILVTGQTAHIGLQLTPAFTRRFVTLTTRTHAAEVAGQDDTGLSLLGASGGMDTLEARFGTETIAAQSIGVVDVQPCGGPYIGVGERRPILGNGSLFTVTPAELAGHVSVQSADPGVLREEDGLLVGVEPGLAEVTAYVDTTPATTRSLWTVRARFDHAELALTPDMEARLAGTLEPAEPGLASHAHFDSDPPGSVDAWAEAEGGIRVRGMATGLSLLRVRVDEAVAGVATVVVADVHFATNQIVLCREHGDQWLDIAVTPSEAWRHLTFSSGDNATVLRCSEAMLVAQGKMHLLATATPGFVLHYLQPGAATLAANLDGYPGAQTDVHALSLLLPGREVPILRGIGYSLESDLGVTLEPYAWWPLLTAAVDPRVTVGRTVGGEITVYSQVTGCYTVTLSYAGTSIGWVALRVCDPWTEPHCFNGTRNVLCLGDVATFEIGGPFDWRDSWVEADAPQFVDLRMIGAGVFECWGIAPGHSSLSVKTKGQTVPGLTPTITVVDPVVNPASAATGTLLWVDGPEVDLLAINGDPGAWSAAGDAMTWESDGNRITVTGRQVGVGMAVYRVDDACAGTGGCEVYAPICVVDGELPTREYVLVNDDFDEGQAPATDNADTDAEDANGTLVWDDLRPYVPVVWTPTVFEGKVVDLQLGTVAVRQSGGPGAVRAFVESGNRLLDVWANGTANLAGYLDAESESGVTTWRLPLWLEGLTPGDVELELLLGTNVLAVATVTVFRADLVPDFNHDRVIDATDKTQLLAKGPFRFWINDDADVGDVAVGASDVPGAGSGANCRDGRVNGRCDLLDFFPVWLDIKAALAALPERTEYVLRQQDAAVKVVCTDLESARAGDYLTTDGSTYGPALNQNSYAAEALSATAGGAALPQSFLDAIRNRADRGVLMAEGADVTTAPLVLEFRLDGQLLGTRDLPLSLHGVERMYRTANLRTMQNPGQLATPQNNPDSLSNGKNLVFLHGYQPSDDADWAAGWLTEMFKRLYWSGSQAKFHGVRWLSNQGDDMDYQKNVTNAFCTAPVLKDYVIGLNGQVTVVAHSLGNMVVSSAIVDHNMSVRGYILCDAAVASEAYDVLVAQESSLRNVWWADYSNRTWVANWYQLFGGTGDSRANLTWCDRFADIIRTTEIWNFHSSGDEVFSLTTNPGLLSGAIEIGCWGIIPISVNVNFGRYSWQKQELFKGIRYSDGWASFGGTAEAGWGFEEATIQIQTVGDSDEVSLVPIYTNAVGANAASSDDLRTNPVFKHTPDWLVGTNVLSQNQINEMLGMGISALTPSTGRTQLPVYAVPLDHQKELNSPPNTGFKPNGWPNRGSPDFQNWLHNDMKDVAYLYNYVLFDTITTVGGVR